MAFSDTSATMWTRLNKQYANHSRTRAMSLKERHSPISKGASLEFKVEVKVIEKTKRLAVGKLLRVEDIFSIEDSLAKDCIFSIKAIPAGDSSSKIECSQKIIISGNMFVIRLIEDFRDPSGFFEVIKKSNCFPSKELVQLVLDSDETEFGAWNDMVSCWGEHILVEDEDDDVVECFEKVLGAQSGVKNNLSILGVVNVASFGSNVLDHTNLEGGGQLVLALPAIGNKVSIPMYQLKSGAPCYEKISVATIKSLPSSRFQHSSFEVSSFSKTVGNKKCGGVGDDFGRASKYLRG
ncbi:unnamed protein product [Lupinus luteus]|uniref:Uncharacterized protein n=1 Tax=Lupinus luteus TaxID=3873 RepID=A0AAV1X9W8_LUPLU